MIIKTIASGSAGNAIYVSDGEGSLLLDAGIPYSKLCKAVRLSILDGILITHCHFDHSKAVPELIRRGLAVYMSKGTAEALDINIYNQATHLIPIETANWKILPFDTQHDAPEPLGFLFQSRNTDEKLVYIVDSFRVDYGFKGVTHYLIEANYSDELLQKSSYHEALKNRIRKNHFSIGALKDFLKQSDLSKTKEIHLIHLSRNNADEAVFMREIESQTGVPVYCNNGR